MSEKIKSGKEVIDEFFSEIFNVKNVDKDTVEQLLALYDQKKLTNTQIQNALDGILQKELSKK